MLGGMIAGALGGGAKAVGEIADNRIRANTQKELSAYENELAMEREAARQRLAQAIGREDQQYNTTGEGGQAQLQFDAARGRQANDIRIEGMNAETPALVSREEALGPARAESARLQVEAQATGSRNASRAYGADKGAQAGDRAKANAGESDSVRASRAASTAATNDELIDRREERGLRRAAAAARANNNPEGVAAIEGIIASRFGPQRGGGGGGGVNSSLGDVVQTAAQFNKLAEAAEMEGDVVRARALRERAEALLTEVGAQRVPGAQQGPARAPAGQVDLSKAHEDAKRAIETGRISLAEANKRLREAGLAELPAPAEAPKKAPAGTSESETMRLRGGKPIEEVRSRGGVYYVFEGQTYPTREAAQQARGY